MNENNNKKKQSERWAEWLTWTNMLTDSSRGQAEKTYKNKEIPIFPNKDAITSHRNKDRITPLRSKKFYFFTVATTLSPEVSKSEGKLM